MIVNDKIEAAASYSIGGSAIAISLADISTMAQHVALILGCIVVAIRVVHDGIGLIRRIKNKEDGKRE